MPILRLHSEGTDFDLSVNNILPIFNTRLIQAYVDLDPRMATLVKEVKLWVKGKGLSGAQSGHLSSYALTLMAIYYAQNKGALPVLQGPHVPPKLEEGCDVAFEVPATWSSRAEAELSFEGFVRFYAVEYRWGRECVSVRNGKRLDLENYPKLQGLRPRRGISAEEWEISIRIEDPFERSRDLADVLQYGRSAELRAALLAEHAVLIKQHEEKRTREEFKVRVLELAKREREFEMRAATVDRIRTLAATLAFERIAFERLPQFEQALARAIAAGTATCTETARGTETTSETVNSPTTTIIRNHFPITTFQ